MLLWIPLMKSWKHQEDKYNMVNNRNLNKAKSRESIVKRMKVLPPWWMRNSKVTLCKTDELCKLNPVSDSLPGCEHVHLQAREKKLQGR